MNVITKKTTSGSIKTLLKRIKPKKKGFDAEDFSGKLTWKGNPLEIQKKLRGNDR